MLVIDSEFKSQLQPYLEREERLLWAGKPRGGIQFKPFDLFMLPFGLAWFGFALFWTYMAAQSSILFALFGIPFVLVGFGMVAGRFIADAWNRKTMVYGITTERILVKSGISKTVVKSIAIASIADVELVEKKDGSGTIFLGPTGFKALVSSKETLPNARTIHSIAHIPNVREVYNQLLISIKDHKVND